RGAEPARDAGRQAGSTRPAGGSGEGPEGFLMGDLVVGVVVGTGRARAGVLSRQGVLLGRGEQAIALHQPQANHSEHDSEQIWAAVAAAVRAALSSAGAKPEHIAGISFDATCSLVVRDRVGRPLSIS